MEEALAREQHARARVQHPGTPHSPLFPTPAPPRLSPASRLLPPPSRALSRPPPHSPPTSPPQGIEHLSLGSTKIGAMLLVGLFFYDIFWVRSRPPPPPSAAAAAGRCPWLSPPGSLAAERSSERDGERKSLAKRERKRNLTPQRHARGCPAGVLHPCDGLRREAVRRSHQAPLPQTCGPHSSSQPTPGIRPARLVHSLTRAES